MVSCRDQKGLVAALAAAIAGEGCNILDADQHTDPEADMFFQRIRFDESHLVAEHAAIEEAIENVSRRFDMKTSMRYSGRPRRVAVFVSKYDHCLVDLLWRNRAGELDAEIPLVISNHGDLAETATAFGCRFEHMPIEVANKAEQEDKALALLLRQGFFLAIDNFGSSREECPGQRRPLFYRASRSLLLADEQFSTCF